MQEVTEQVFVKNAGDKKQVAQASIKERSLEERNADDLAFLLSNLQGRRFIWRLLRLCGVFRTSMTGDNYTYFNEGQRVIGTTLLKEIHDLQPESYVLMMKESKGYNNV